jgi:catechol 2,3-dioxygenase-like lactoylglutathione lyase family enzyme
MIAVYGLHHLGLTVRDVEASVAFYAAMGYSLEERIAVRGPDGAIGNGLPEAALDVAFMSTPALTLELVQFTPHGPAVLSDGDLSFGTVPVWSGSSPSQDPDGRSLTRLPPSATVTIEVASAAPERTLALLALLGLRTSAPEVMSGEGLAIQILPAVSTRPLPQPNSVGRVHLCWQVEDLGQATAELADAGFGTVSTPRVHENIRWMFVRHPEGPGVELLSIR